MPYANPEDRQVQKRRYYALNREHLKKESAAWRASNPERNREYKRRYKARVRAWLDGIKRAQGCADCGTHEGRLDFDHRPGTVKLFNPSRLDRSSRAALEAEIAKCDVRCAPCHARRHAR